MNLIFQLEVMTIFIIIYYTYFRSHIFYSLFPFLLQVDVSAINSGKNTMIIYAATEDQKGKPAYKFIHFRRYSLGLLFSKNTNNVGIVIINYNC